MTHETGAHPADDVAPRPDLHLAYWAWTIIANAPWDDMPEDWVTAAKTWRGAFHEALGDYGQWGTLYSDGSPEDCPQCGWGEDCVCDKPTARIDGTSPNEGGDPVWELTPHPQRPFGADTVRSHEGDLIVVHWEDTTNIAEWQSRQEVMDFAKDGAWICENVGWCLVDNDDCIVLSGRRAGKIGQYGLTERIPKRNVLHVDRLESLGTRPLLIDGSGGAE